MILGGTDPRQYSFKSSVGSGKGNGILGPVRVYYMHVKTRKLLQICKQVVTRLLSSRYQDVFTLRTACSQCCDKFGTSWLLTITGLVQVVPIRLIQAVCNKLLRASCPLSDIQTC